MYFECNIPKKMPYHMHDSLLPGYNALVKRVYNRMETLEIAKDLTGLDGATFSVLAKTIFDNFVQVGCLDKFDAITPEELAEASMLYYDGSTAEPRMEWPNATVVVDAAFIVTSEWEFIRRLSIGGSDAAVVKGISPYTTRQELYHDKCGTPVQVKSEDATAIFERGHILEDRIVDAFCKATGATPIPETRMFVSKKHPHSSANVDKFVRMKNGDIYVFEAKSSIEDNFAAWINDKIPQHYVCQMYQYPAVMDDSRIKGTYIGCLMTHDFILKDVYLGSTFEEGRLFIRKAMRDEVIEEEQLAAEDEFWNKHIKIQEEPAPEGKTVKQGHSLTDLEVYRKYNGKPDPKLGVLDLKNTRCEQIIEEYLKLGEERKALEKKAQGIKAKQDQIALEITKKMGRNAVGQLAISSDSYYEVKCSPRRKETVDKVKLEQAYPEAYADCVSVDLEASQSFSIRIKEDKESKRAS